MAHKPLQVMASYIITLLYIFLFTTDKAETYEDNTGDHINVSVPHNDLEVGLLEIDPGPNTLE